MLLIKIEYTELSGNESHKLESEIPFIKLRDKD